MSQPMILLEQVSFGYEGQKEVLHQISLAIEAGESVGLIGANGAGKSTLLKLVLGLLSGSGTILVQGVKVIRENLPRVRQMLGFVLQNSDNQMFMPTVLEDMIFGPLNYGCDREEALKRGREILTSLGCEDLEERYNHKISGGEKKMAAIATVLMMEPDAILMDEPTASLDPFNRRMIIQKINALPQTKVITSHDLDMIYDTCERVILLSEGRIAADGPAEEILRDQKLLEANRMELPLRFQKTRS